FVPQVLGIGKIAQFRTEAYLGAGYYLCLSAAAIAVFFGYCRLRAPRVRRARVPIHAVRTAVLVAGTFFGGMMCPPPIPADTLIVGPTDSTLTLSEALAQASDGDTILVRGGVHTGPLVVRKSVHIIGERRPVLDGRGRGTVVQLEARGAELRGFAVRA